jgi:energy-coupling factor transporter ATP-binding protein EcfA2
MKLHFKAAWKSITSLSCPDLPALTVITGPNGSGKTHLLEAIHQGHVTADALPKEATTYYQVKDFRVSASELKQTAPRPNTHVRSLLSKLSSLAALAAASHMDLFGDRWLEVLALAKKYSFSPETFDNKLLKKLHDAEVLDDALATALNTYRAKWHPQPRASLTKEETNELTSVVDLANHLGKSVYALDLHDVYEHFDFLRAAKNRTTSSLSLNLTDAFRSYLLRFNRNRYNCYLAIQFNEDIPFLSDADFESKYGKPPWILLNEILGTTHDLRYVFPPPQNEHSTNPDDCAYVAELLDVEKHEPRDLDVLSSGEHVLLKLASSIYVSDNFESDRLPRLLLLDEVDSVLHPKMIARFLSLVRDRICRDRGIGVLLASHAPTTVALPPEDSIFVMDNRKGTLSRAPKEAVLDALCEGVVRISERKRFIFVEGLRDQRFYQMTFRRLVELSKVPTQPALLFEFPKPEKTVAAVGKQEVAKLANIMRQSGLSEMFGGLIDCDGEGVSQDNLFSTIRWEVENWLFDPLAVAIAALAQGRTIVPALGFLDKSQAYKLEKVPIENLQNVVNEICERIQTSIESMEKELLGLRACGYANGITLNMPRWVYEYPGKRIEQAMYAEFDGSIINQESCILAYTHADFIPADLGDLFRAMQAA